MMNVRDVGMPMFQILVLVFVAMTEQAGERGERLMPMAVMPLPMPMPMRVDRSHMEMIMGVTIPEEKAPREAHEG